MPKKATAVPVDDIGVEPKKAIPPLRDSLKKYNVKLQFTSPILGSAPANPEVYKDYVAAKKADATPEDVATEVAMIPPDLERAGKTIFRVDPKTQNLVFLPHMIRGFMKESASAITGKEITAFKSKIDKYAFVFPDIIPLMRDGQPLQKADTDNQRPLKAMTAMGPRISLLNSEQVNEGISIEFEIHVLPLGQKDISKEILERWFEYGAYQGISQWRNGGYGRFTFELTEQEPTKKK